MLLYGLITGLITLWIIICTFLAFCLGKVHKNTLYIYIPHTNLFHQFTSSPLQRPVDILNAPEVLPSLYHRVFICIRVKWGTIVISCNQAVHGNGFDEATSFCGPEIHNLVAWVPCIEHSAIVTKWVYGLMVPITSGKMDGPFLPSWIKVVTAIPFTCYSAILALWVDWLRSLLNHMQYCCGRWHVQATVFLEISGPKIWVFILEFNMQQLSNYDMFFSIFLKLSLNFITAKLSVLSIFAEKISNWK